MVFLPPRCWIKRLLTGSVNRKNMERLRVCTLKAVPKTTGDLKLELSISAEFMINGHPVKVVAHAKPFITSTLGQSPGNTNIDSERDHLKHLLKELDEEFYRDVAIEKSKHTPQNDF